MGCYSNQKDDYTVLSMVVGVIGVLTLGFSERQLTIIYFAITAMEQAHKKKPTFLSKRGITQTELQEIKEILEDFGDEETPDSGSKETGKEVPTTNSPYL